MEKLLYDNTNPESIEKYSKNLIGKSFKEILEEYFFNIGKNNFKEFEKTAKYYNNPRGKGSLGNLIEKYFFMYEPNSISEPDFPKAGVELKVTPYKRLKSGKYSAGERLVIGMIPYNREITGNFEESHLLDKIRLILLVLYLRDKEKQRIDYIINYSKLFSILGEECEKDLEIIKSDYEIITNKIINGKAHELSESDTMYLGACTKGETASKSLTSQFYNKDIKAKRRAFSLKQGYMTYVYNKYIFEDVDTYEKIIDEKVDLKSFEKIVKDKILLYRGMSETSLRNKFGLVNDTSKDILSRIIFAILGIKSNNAEEFIKSDTVIKTIRVEQNGNIKESMSFPTIKFKELAEEEWEESFIYNYFSQKRFLFIIFRNNGDEYILDDVIFWNMPISELEKIGYEEWKEIQSIVKKGVKFNVKGNRVYNNLPKAKNTKIFHLRPHTKKSAYLIKSINYTKNDIKKFADELPNGDFMTKQCFWINKNYILNIIEKKESRV